MYKKKIKIHSHSVIDLSQSLLGQREWLPKIKIWIRQLRRLMGCQLHGLKGCPDGWRNTIPGVSVFMEETSIWFRNSSWTDLQTNSNTFRFWPWILTHIGAAALENVGLFSRLFLLLVLSPCFTIKIFTV